jgi:hypothetical protein
MRGKRAAAVVIAALVLGSGTAWATVQDRERYSGTDSWSYDDCGFTIDVEAEFGGNYLARIDKGGQAFYVNDNYWYRDVHTNPDTGKWFVLRGDGLFHDVKATPKEGTVYEFVSIQSGQPFVIEDSTGRVVVRDRGVIRFTYLFDTLGDGTPGGTFVADVDIAVNGPHPGFADDFPFCEIAADLTSA